MLQKVLIITGMHRSGTSLTAQYLAECGLFLGYNLHNSDKSNTQSAYDGHHEDEDFLQFHKQILAAKRIYSFPTSSFRVPVRPGKIYQNKALELLSLRSDLEQWSWKDPRTTLFLDFWNELLPSPKYLLLFRDPLAVVDSLIRRGTDDQIKQKPVIALKSWQVYNRCLLNFVLRNKDNCLLYQIDEVISSPDLFVDIVSMKLGIELKKVSFEKIYTQKALKMDLSDVAKALQKKHPRDIHRAKEIYQDLVKVSGMTKKSDI